MEHSRPRLEVKAHLGHLVVEASDDVHADEDVARTQAEARRDLLTNEGAVEVGAPVR